MAVHSCTPIRRLLLPGEVDVGVNAVGDGPNGSIGGLVHDDTRFLGRCELMINNCLLLALGADTVDYYSAAFFLNDLPMRCFRQCRDCRVARSAAVKAGCLRCWSTGAAPSVVGKVAAKLEPDVVTSSEATPVGR
jgi:hypothetical protein